MHNTKKNAPASAQSLLEASFVQYKDDQALSDEAIEIGAIGRQETIVIDLYLRLMKELTK